MSEEERITKNEDEGAAFSSRSVSRREFLKIAGIAGAAVGMGAGLGEILAACGDEEETTTTAAGETTTTAPAETTTTAAESTTTVSAVETGREIKIGFVAPLTGPIALFGVPDQYCVERAQEAIGDGVVCGDGLKHPITILTRDSQSDTNRAAQVTGDLINNDGVDMVLGASTPDVCVPVADQAEANATPCLTCDAPWQSYVGTRTQGDLAAVFDWTYHVFWGAEDMAAVFLDIFSQVETNQVVATMYGNDADGLALQPIFVPAYEGAGYTVSDGSFYNIGTEDYSAEIGQFKTDGAEIGTGIFVPPDFTTFWKQSIQQGWVPKIATYAKALLFPGAVEAIGPIANGLTTEVWWTPNHPFTSSLLGETCQQFADEFTNRTGLQWTQPLMHFLVFEWALDVFRRVPDVEDKDAIMTTVKGTNLETLAGPLDFAAAVEPAGPPWEPGPRHVHPNVYKSPLVGGQWRTSDEWPFDLTIVGNPAGPMITVQDSVQPYTGA